MNPAIVLPGGFVTPNSGGGTGALPSLAVYKTVGSQTVPHYVETVISFNSVVIDTANAWDSLNNAYVCPRAGKLLGAFHVWVAATVPYLNLIKIRVTRDSTIVYETASDGIYADPTLDDNFAPRVTFGVYSVQAGDVIDAVVFQVASDDTADLEVTNQVTGSGLSATNMVLEYIT